MHKSPLKETLFQGNCTKCKTDVIVADHTNSAKLVLWEDIIDKVDSGKSYQFNNCKIRIFDDHKYIKHERIYKDDRNRRHQECKFDVASNSRTYDNCKVYGCGSQKE